MDDEFPSYADLGRRKDHQAAICERLGIDPAKTTDLTVEIVPGSDAVVRWSGVQRVPLGEIAGLVAPPADPS